MSSSCWRSIITLLVTGIAFQSQVFAAEPTAKECLEHYQMSLSLLNRCRIEFATTYELVESTIAELGAAPSDRKSVLSDKRITTVCRDEHRWRILNELLPNARDINPANQYSHYIERVLDGSDIQINQYNWFMKDSSYNPRVETTVSQKAAGPYEIARAAVGSQGGGSLLFGCLSGDDGKSIPEVMLTGELDPVVELANFDGFSTRLIKSKGIYGQHKVWLDPMHGYLPRRIEVLKQPGDRSNDKILLTEADAKQRREQQQPNRRNNVQYFGGESRLLVHRIEINKYANQVAGKQAVEVEIPDSYEIERWTFSNEGTPKQLHSFVQVADLAIYHQKMPDGLFLPTISKDGK